MLKRFAGKGLEWLPIARSKKKPTRDDIIKSIPVRNENLRWFKEDGEVKLFIPRKKGRFGDLAGRMFRLPDEKQLVLDKVGSGVWEMCDGLHSVGAILDYIQRRHKLSRREAEVSLGVYLKDLSERRLIGIKSADQKYSKNNGSKKTRKTSSSAV